MIIEANNVSFSFDDDSHAHVEKVLTDINLKIEKGSFVAILGRNGSGKSTLAKHFNALLKPKTGNVYVCSMNTCDDEKVFDIRALSGMFFKNPDNQAVAAIVEDEVAFAPENLGVESAEIRKRVDECLKTVGMSEFALSSVANLSGGQKQRTAIAAVLAMKGEVIILDESTAMLDPKGRKEVLKTVKKLNREENLTVIMITHYMDEAAMADRVVVMDDGNIALDGTPKEVFKNVELLKSLGLDVPQVTELSWLLNKSGITLPDDIINVDECLIELVKVLGVAPRD